jgi:hypothetical protein
LSEKIVVDFGQVNLKSLVLTNDIEQFERLKAQGNIGVLFEPKVLVETKSQEITDFYLVGIRKEE